MNKFFSPTKRSVKFLTLFTLLGLAQSCSIINSRYGESCKTHAHLQFALSDFISKRYHSHSPVRMAIIPFSAPANLTAQNMERPGIGNQIAWRLHALLLANGTVPIVEIMNRQDWPGKKEEFFTGNFGAIAAAREAGYDLVMVGYIDGQKGLDNLMVHSKIIEAESGISVWYGSIEAWTRRPEMKSWSATFGLDEQRPDLVYLNDLVEKAARCTVEAVTSDQI